MIQFLSVSKIYPNQYRALEDINFEIQEGEFVFLIGASGSGKTTIIRHIIREESPTDGRVYFDDEDITKYKRSKVYALRRKIGVIFQDYKLINDKNAFENVAFAMEAAGKSHKDIIETVPYLLEIVGLQDRGEAFPTQLSGGEKQRVAIARAIANNPKLLIADEPTGNLDPDAAWDIVQILTKINNWGTTVLMSTHGSEIVDTLSKRVLVIDHGKIIRDAIKGKYKDINLDIAKAKIKLDKKKQEEATKKTKAKSKDTKESDPRPQKDEKSVIPQEEEVTEITKKIDVEIPTIEIPNEKVEQSQTELVADEKQIDEKEAEETSSEAIESSGDKTPEATIESKDKPEEVFKGPIKKAKKPPVSLTQRRQKDSAKEAENFEQRITEKFEQANKNAAKKETEKTQISDETDIKKLNLSPKLISILKAFGYDTVNDLKVAGFSKISKIDELSVKDIKNIKKILKT